MADYTQALRRDEALDRCVRLDDESLYWIEYVDWANPVLREPLAIVDGHATPPDRPGTGLAWTSEAIARYRVDCGHQVIMPIPATTAIATAPRPNPTSSGTPTEGRNRAAR